MNEEKWKKFADAYHAGLRKAVTEYPDEYMPTVVSNPDATADKMLKRVRDWIESGNKAAPFNKDGRGFKNGCKTLGIKHTYVAMREYLTG